VQIGKVQRRCVQVGPTQIHPAQLGALLPGAGMGRRNQMQSSFAGWR
jgi:hypothetical protein